MKKVKDIEGGKPATEASREAQCADSRHPPHAAIFDLEFDVSLPLDNSLQRFANDSFIIEKTKIANRKFAKNKP
jgi:hypothetical protein